MASVLRASAVELANRNRLKETEKNGTPDVELLPGWSPNRLRHTAATDIRKRFGLEAAQVALGHALPASISLSASKKSKKLANYLTVSSVYVR